MLTRPVMSRDELTALIDEGSIDSVVMGFVDRYGRLTGKRATGRFFVDHVADHGTENCDYLLTCNIENDPATGFRFSSFDKGYGDMVARADWSTVRIIPWVPRTALVMCDLFSVETGDMVEVAPRTILRRQVEAAAAMGYLPMVGSEIEFYLYRDSYEEAHARGYSGLSTHSNFAEDYNILQTTRDEYVIGDIRRALEGAGIPVEFSKGEAGRGQHEINLSYSTALEMADRNHIYKNAAKEIAATHGRSVTFMAKPSMSDVGSSCHVHASLWSLDGATALFADHHGEHGASELFRRFVAGQIATARDFSLLWGRPSTATDGSSPVHGRRRGWVGASTTAPWASAKWATVRRPAWRIASRGPTR